jgi:multiple sugar transport system permease protein
VAYVTNNPNVSFFSSVPQVYFSLLAIDIWQWLPFVVTIVLAGLSSIPRAPLEAADIDGAKGLKRLRYITLPLLKPTLAIVLLFRLIDGFKGFEVVYLFTGGGPGTATNFMSWNIFKTGLGIVQNIGLSSAYAVVFLIVVLAIAWPLMYLMYRLQR